MPEIDVTKDSVIGELLYQVPGLSQVFMSVGMHCLHCGSAQNETLEEACFVHGIDCDTLIDEIEAHLAFIDFD